MEKNDASNNRLEKIFFFAVGIVSLCLIGLLVYKIATGKESKDFQLCRDLGGVPIPSTWDSTNLSRCDNFPQ